MGSMGSYDECLSIEIPNRDDPTIVSYARHSEFEYFGHSRLQFEGKPEIEVPTGSKLSDRCRWHVLYTFHSNAATTNGVPIAPKSRRRNSSSSGEFSRCPAMHVEFPLRSSRTRM